MNTINCGFVVWHYQQDHLCYKDNHPPKITKGSLLDFLKCILFEAKLYLLDNIKFTLQLLLVSFGLFLKPQHIPWEFFSDAKLSRKSYSSWFKRFKRNPSFCQIDRHLLLIKLNHFQTLTFFTDFYIFHKKIKLRIHSKQLAIDSASQWIAK